MISSLLIGILAAFAAFYIPVRVTPARLSVATFDETAYGWLFAHRGPEPPIPQVVIAQINKPSIDNVKDIEGFDYPFPRSVHARVLRVLKQAGAKIVGMDILFTQERDPAEDRALAAALKDCGNVVLAAEFTTSTVANADVVSNGQDFPAAPFRDSALAFGPVDIPPDEDGLVRRFILMRSHPSVTDVDRNEDYAQFAVRVAGAYKGISQDRLVSDLHRRLFNGEAIPRAHDDWQTYKPGNSARICFTGLPYQSCPLLDYDQILYWGQDPAALEAAAGNSSKVAKIPRDPAAMAQLAREVSGKIVLIGSTDESEHDSFDTPLREPNISPKRPGVEIQASIIHTLLANHFYRPVSEWIRLLLLALLPIGMALLTLGLRPVRASIAFLVVLSLFGYIEVLMFAHRVFMRPGELLAALVLAYVLETIFLYLTEERHAKEARRHFGRYVGPKVMEKVLDTGHVALSGEIRHLAIMFTDVQGFTSLSETLAPAEAVSVLNRYLTKMVDCIFRYEGTLDKIMGDGIMAYFGAPNPLENPELQAVLCAIEMQQVMREWREECTALGLPPLKKRIGIHSGQVLVGEIGSANQVGYTVIGDTVNVAARLEPLNKDYGTEILISDAVQQRLPDTIQLEHKGEVPIRGRKEAVHAYSVQVPTREPAGATRG